MLRDDALAIWQAGVAAVDSRRLVMENLRVSDGMLEIGDLVLPLQDIRNIRVVGAGKAGAGMAVGVVEALGARVAREHRLEGWVNVPDDCLDAVPTEGLVELVKLHGARPAGVNEPSERGVLGAERILQLVSDMTSDDLCLCLLSGGASALLPAPAEGVPLEEKLALTRALSAAGANIQQLNTVRKQLSQIKGGRLARACRAGRLVSLIISDVIGDPLDVIASGPTVLDSSTPADALQILMQLGISETTAPRALAYLQQQAAHAADHGAAFPCAVHNLVIGNNAVAVDAAGQEAERRGYRQALHVPHALEGAAEDVGRHLARMALSMRSGSEAANIDCLITGGEPTVTLAPAEKRGLGGRNQQLVLAALVELLAAHGTPTAEACRDIVLLSGGTDGEDGPTDAAGAIIDEQLVEKVLHTSLDPADYLARNDAYHFFEPLGGLIKTGPTHTNVCDVRVVVVKRRDG